VVLTRLKEEMDRREISPELLAEKSKGDFSNMTVRRALAGRGIDRLKAKAIARVVGVKLEDLV
jgi:hypothetical protein